ncbi:MAG: acetate--CoA ligase family protein, partial [Gammaproteobacteria bacterium]|nr:acetate--CoA ligase family protein [Gammaproteobacteria bacterium]
MGTRNLDRIFNPRQVALVGASDKPSDVGYIVFRNLLDARFHGVVYPVTPDREAVQGIQAYPDISSLPKCPDLAVICSALPDIPRQVEACGEAGVPGVLIISHGRYGNQTESTELKREIGDIARKFRGLRILGPNALGIIRPGIGLNASLTGSMPKPGHLALICQSGALANAILDRAVQKGIGLSHFVSAGEMLDVSFGDFIDYLGMDYSTRAIILYVQSIDRSREFMSAARAFAKTKPIVAYKAGRFNASAQAVALHSGALVVEDAVYEAAFQRAGVVRALELDDIFDIAELLACQRLPQGARLAIVSNAGGAAIVAADALLAHQGTLAELTEKTMTQLGEALPLCNIRGNPVDLTDEAPPQFFSDAIRIVLTDRGVDAVLVLLTPQVMTNPKATAIQLQDVAKGAHKPVLAAWMGGLKVRKGIRILNRAGLPTHASPEHAVRAFMHLVTYTRNLKNLYETPRDIPINFPLDRRRRHQNLDRLAGEEHQYMTDYQTKRLLQAYGIPVCETHEAFSGREAVKVARKIGKAVALKVLTTPQIVHKSDVGGVALNLQNARQIRQAYDYLMESVAARRPDVKIEGVTVQEMVEDQRGFEMILGAKKDPTFGAVIMTGLGGLATGIFQDRALGLPPINERLAWNMLESLRSWPLLQGHRGQPGVDLDRVIEILMRFSYLVADYPEFLEIDINPLL